MATTMNGLICTPPPRSPLSACVDGPQPLPCLLGPLAQSRERLLAPPPSEPTALYWTAQSTTPAASSALDTVRWAVRGRSAWSKDQARATWTRGCCLAEGGRQPAAETLDNTVGCSRQ
jgi:hypothetical protein